MIKSVELTNFQSHRHTILPMGDFTVITGGSNGGKSSVLRALTALARNDAAGDYITYGESFLKVKVTLDTNTSIEWTKGKNENSYRIIWPDGGESYFQKVGADVPDEVKEILKLSPIVMEGGQKVQVNIHEQLEAPFLIQDTPGYVAKVFGELTSASKLYTAVSEGIRRASRDKATKKVRKEDLDELDVQLRDYALLDQYIALVEDARIFANAATVIETKSTAATILSEAIRTKVDEISATDSRIEALQPVLVVDIESIDQATSEIQLIVQASQYIEQSIRSIYVLQDALEDLKVLPSVPSLDEIEDIQETVEGLTAVFGGYTSLSERILIIQDNITTINKGLSSVDKRIEEAYTYLDSCPSCGQDLTEDAKEILVSGRETLSFRGNNGRA